MNKLNVSLHSWILSFGLVNTWYIKIDKRKSSEERMLDFLVKVKNPYIFKIKGRLVRIRFSNNGKTADDCLTGVLKNLYR